MEDLFTNNERNNALRPNILKQFISNVMTDDERARLWGLPEGCRMRENAKIISPENLRCGEYVWIGEGSLLDASGGLEIGAHTAIGLYTMIFTHSSVLSNLTMNQTIGNGLISRKPVKIGKGCFIGSSAVILSGITIGDRSVIMPLSLVHKDVPPNSIVMGNPARVIQNIDDEYIEKLKAELKG